MSKINRLETSYYKSLTRKMAFILILVSFTPMILVSGFILNQFQFSYREKIHAHLKEIVLKHKQNIDRFLIEKLSAISFLSSSFTFEDLCNEEFLKQQLTSLRREFGTVFEDIGVINADGRQLAYAGPFKLEKADYSEADWFKKAINTRHSISDVFMGLRSKPHFIVSVRKQYNGQYWILRATIDFLSFNSLVENLRIGRTGFAFILNQAGEFQTKPFMETVPGTEHDMFRFLKAAEKSSEQVYIVERKNALGREKIYAGAMLKNDEWLLIYQQQKHDAFIDLEHARNIALVILLIGGIGIVLTAIIFAKRMVKHIALADREKEMMSQQVIETGKLASVGELAAGIAHEINNPVAIMVEEAGWIEDLLEDEDLKQSENLEEFHRALKQINIQGRRCKEITHKLLSFARKTDSRIQEVQLNEMVEDVVALSAQQAKYDNVEIRTSLQNNLPTIHLSHTEVQQVLLNLINNAIYALNQKGGIIEIITRMSGEYIIVDVADNGPGIPRAILGRIFDPFFTTKPVGKGSGLGLSICYGIIKRIGGEIDVKSMVDEGTTFSIKIPVNIEGSPESDLVSDRLNNNQV
ncbi:Two component system sensor histidine kinase, double cache domain-containing [Desulfonema limicola]|uniref:histidine kinase n=1 Tax=Desulfonema limicola TaxID=45656 RepID=A0A975GIW9_9BACT|nr:PAS domain-containing sensor histidine kinase [Desulfonema limicola]QTA83025.1 Two component system sensor histidine kinase, double cache domain-containing [Desulfonema limicola]